MIEHLLLRCYDKSGFVREKLFPKGCWNLNKEIEKVLFEFNSIYGVIYGVLDDLSEEIICVFVR